MALPSLWLEDFGIFSLPPVWPQLAPLSIPGIKQELGTWVNEWYCLTLSSFAQTSPSPLSISPLGKRYYKLYLSLTFFILSVWGKQIHMDRSVLSVELYLRLQNGTKGKVSWDFKWCWHISSHQQLMGDGLEGLDCTQDTRSFIHSVKYWVWIVPEALFGIRIQRKTRHVLCP